MKIPTRMIFAGALLCSGVAYGATTFSDDFAGGVASTNWENAGSVDLTANNATFTGTNNSDRVYLRTNDADYNGSDFSATVTLTRATDGGGSGSMFFGIGNGVNPGGGAPTYGEPASGEFIYLRLRSLGWTGELADVSSTGGGNTTFGLANNTAGSTMDIRFNFVAATGTGTFTIDTDANGFDALDPKVSKSNLNLSGTDSKIFFGGNNGGSGDNFSVAVPEPTAAALGALGLLGLLRRRRA